MVVKEHLVYLIDYNAVRALIFQAGRAQGLSPLAKFSAPQSWSL